MRLYGRDKYNTAGVFELVKLPTTVIALCSCRGRIAEMLSLDDIAQFLRLVAPDVPVVICDDLCERNAIYHLSKELGAQALVVGACSQLSPKLYLWEEAASKLFHSIRIVDILKEASMPYGSTVVAERVKLLLWAQVRRISVSKQVRQENLKLVFSRHGDKVSRRGFLAAALPRYEVIPFIEFSKCRGKDKCRICYDSCPLRAVLIQEDVVTIDESVCLGCGSCVAVCPHDAIYYPTFSNEEIDEEMRGLLFDEGISLEPRIIALICQTCLTDHGDVAGHHAPGIVPLKLPCMDMVSPWLMLRAFDMGAQGIAIISGVRKCRAHANSTILQDNIEFVQALLGHWGIEPERIKVFEVTETNMVDIMDELKRFSARIMNSGSTSLRLSDCTSLSVEVPRLKELIEAMNNQLPHMTDGNISAGVVPFGKVTLGSNRCTGCGLCAIDCPTGALMFLTSEDNTGYRLLFHHGSCVACGVCINVCPEKCLELQRILEIDKICHSESLLSDSIVSCRRCGKPVAPKSMIESLRSRLEKSGNYPVDQLELCSTCKADTVRHKPNEGENNLVTATNKGCVNTSRPYLGGI